MGIVSGAVSRVRYMMNNTARGVGWREMFSAAVRLFGVASMKTWVYKRANHAT